MIINIDDNELKMKVSDITKSVLKDMIIEKIEKTDAFEELILDSARVLISEVMKDDIIKIAMKEAIKENIENGYITGDDDVTHILIKKTVEMCNKI